ncbi:MAG: hypothetical protein Q7P63_13395 [Verrucomicrobiota bacterium JB022]|nr:hypothetical protein [Verrucomicrobiota bacterium JB022]
MGNVAKTAVQELAKLLRQALLPTPGAPAWLNVVKTVAVLVAVLAIIAVGGALYTGLGDPVLLVLMGLMALLFLAVLIAVFSSRGETQPAPIWEKRVVILPQVLPAEHELPILLEFLQQRAIETAQAALGHEIGTGDIRVAVFLPNYRDSERLGILSTNDDLMVNFPFGAEREIVFFPGEGLVGSVFLQQRTQFVSARLENGVYVWPASYTLTNEHLRRISPDLRWTLGLPLAGEHHNPLGVLVLDGLGFELSESEAPKLLDGIRQEYLAILASIGKLPKKSYRLYEYDARTKTS